MCSYNCPVQELVTPRLRLRPVQESDLAFLLNLWNDPLVMRYAGFPQGKGWGGAGRIACMTDVKLAPAFWGQGYATEALQALLGFYFTAAGTEELLVQSHAQNPAALRLYEKCGFVDIGPSPWPGHRLLARTRGHYLAGLPG